MNSVHFGEMPIIGESCEVNRPYIVEYQDIMSRFNDIISVTNCDELVKRQKKFAKTYDIYCKIQNNQNLIKSLIEVYDDLLIDQKCRYII
jgi:hypothetical protein